MMRKSYSVAPALFTYTINPDQVFVALSTSLTLVITNPASSSSVSLKGGRQGDEIDVTFPVPPGQTEADSLVDKVTFSSTSLTAGFTVGPQTPGSNIFVIRPIGTQPLAPGQTIQVRFDNVIVNSAVGSPSVIIQEFIGSSKGSPTLPMRKLPQELNVIAWLSPFIIGLGGNSTLYWQSFGGTKVTVFGLATGQGQQVFPVSGDPPYPGNMSVTLKATDAQRTFSVQVMTNDNRHFETSVTLTQGSPCITFFGPAGAVPGPPLKGDASVQLSWTTLYAPKVFLQTPAEGAAKQFPPNTSTTVTPGVDAINGAPDFQHIPAVVTYTLQAPGFGPAASQEVSFSLASVRLLYFKYMNLTEQGQLSNIRFSFDTQWSAQELSLGDVATLVVYQPGGAIDTYFLGSGDSTHPQIQYFNASPVGGNYSLSWVTANLQSLTLEPSGTTIPVGEIASGSMVVSPTETTTYVLTGLGTNGQSIQSYLTVNLPGA